MPTGSQPVADLLATTFPDVDFAAAPLTACKRKADEQVCVHVPAAKLVDVLRFLRNDDRCVFDQLSDLTCVDYLNYPDARDRYGVCYSLVSTTLGHRTWVKCFVNDPEPEVPSATCCWKGANWPEREVFDLFGIRFTDHPDLRRIMTWDGFEAHPLRKDYPLQGLGERENFDVVTRDQA